MRWRESRHELNAFRSNAFHSATTFETHAGISAKLSTYLSWKQNDFRYQICGRTITEVCERHFFVENLMKEEVSPAEKFYFVFPAVLKPFLANAISLTEVINYLNCTGMEFGAGRKYCPRRCWSSHSLRFHDISVTMFFLKHHWTRHHCQNFAFHSERTAVSRTVHRFRSTWMYTLSARTIMKNLARNILWIFQFLFVLCLSHSLQADCATAGRGKWHVKRSQLETWWDSRQVLPEL